VFHTFQYNAEKKKTKHNKFNCYPTVENMASSKKEKILPEIFLHKFHTQKLRAGLHDELMNRRAALKWEKPIKLLPEVWSHLHLHHFSLRYQQLKPPSMHPVRMPLRVC